MKRNIPVSASVYKVDEELFAYNKDSDQWFCFMGNHTVSCKKTKQTKRGKTYDQLSYLFCKQQCVDCPHRDICIGKKKSKARKLQVAASAPLFYELSQEQKQPEFQEKYKKRAAQEWKNAEMKRFHGMSRARGWGLRGLRIQVKLTAIAVNLKRIAALVHALKPKNEDPCTNNTPNKGNNTVFISYFVNIYAQMAKKKAQNLCTATCA